MSEKKMKLPVGIQLANIVLCIGIWFGLQKAFGWREDSENEPLFSILICALITFMFTNSVLYGYFRSQNK
ncbi:MAG: hypothetical protein VCC01_08395 [Candidatus Hydrogenedentota bacterium]